MSMQKNDCRWSEYHELMLDPVKASVASDRKALAILARLESMLKGEFSQEELSKICYLVADNVAGKVYVHYSVDYDSFSLLKGIRIGEVSKYSYFVILMQRDDVRMAIFYIPSSKEESPEDRLRKWLKDRVLPQEIAQDVNVTRNLYIYVHCYLPNFYREARKGGKYILQNAVNGINCTRPIGCVRGNVINLYIPDWYGERFVEYTP